MQAREGRWQIVLLHTAPCPADVEASTGQPSPRVRQDRFKENQHPRLAVGAVGHDPGAARRGGVAGARARPAAAQDPGLGGWASGRPTGRPGGPSSSSAPAGRRCGSRSGRSTMIPEPDRADAFVAATPAAVGNAGAPALRLGAWEGPLDLLLELARAQRVDLAQLSIATLAEQFTAAVDARSRAGRCRCPGWPSGTSWRPG